MQLLEWHRQLEIDLLELWVKVNLHTLMPAVPFFSVALTHFLCDANQDTGIWVGTFLLTVALLVVVFLLQPISKLGSQFNSALAFKGIPQAQFHGDVRSYRRPGGLAIHAVVRSLANEPQTRSPAEDQQYAIYLEYVQKPFNVALGIPGQVMAVVDKNLLDSVVSFAIWKLPLLVTVFMSLRGKIDDFVEGHHNHTAGVSF